MVCLPKLYRELADIYGEDVAHDVMINRVNRGQPRSLLNARARRKLRRLSKVTKQFIAGKIEDWIDWFTAKGIRPE